MKGDGWETVSRKRPCPVCRRPDWCRVSVTTGVVNCMRIASGHAVANGGWIHAAPGAAPANPGTVRGPPQGGVASAAVATPGASYDPPDFNALLWWQAVRHIARWERMDPWADTLGLPVDALDVMGGCVLGEMLAFPMYDGHGAVCGIRTRTGNGQKRAVTGSRAGVFLCGLTPDADVVVCEGPTDATAALALGFWPIGRPSCSGCERHVVDTCRRLDITRVTVCADADGPGVAGARRLADILQAARLGIRMVTPGGHKDLRDWFKAGATRGQVDAQWSQAEWRA